MDTKTGGQVDATTPKKRHSRVPNGGKGRPRGAKNKVTKATLKAIMQSSFMQQKESAADFWKDILGIDTPKDGQINGKAVDVRQRLKKAMEEVGQPGTRRYRLTPEDVAFVRLGMSYAVGLPLKAQPDKSGKPRMPFIGRNGLPWEFDPMYDQERLALEAQKDQQKIDAQARQQQLRGTPVEQVDDEDDGEAPEVVRG
jgi:hypothetical protein